MTALTLYPSLFRLGYDEQQPEAKADLDGAMLVKQQSLEQFLSSIEKRAYRIATLATGDGEEALDLVQDAMFKLVEKYSTKSEEEWPALFHCILQSKIRDWYRRTKVRKSILGFLGGSNDDEEVDQIQLAKDQSMRNPEYDLEIDRTMALLEESLHQLPLRQQQAFILRVWEGLDVKQTAKAMTCSEGSVKTHYSRAVHSLRDSLGESWSRE